MWELAKKGIRYYDLYPLIFSVIQIIDLLRLVLLFHKTSKFTTDSTSVGFYGRIKGEPSMAFAGGTKFS